MTHNDIIDFAIQAGWSRLEAKQDKQPLMVFAELIAAKEREICAKIPRQHALEMVDGIFGKRFPDEAIAVLRATDAMAEKIKARGKQ